jgi:hypothetical protein
MDWRTEESVFDFWQEEGILFPLKVPDRLWGPPRLSFSGYRGILPRGKAAGA